MILSDSGTPDIVEPDAPQHSVEDLPDEVLIFLLGSRYCETDRLSDIAWSLFGTVPPGWGRVQAIVDLASSGRGGGGVCGWLWWHCRGGNGNRHGAEHDRAGSEGIGAGRTIGAGSAAGSGTQTRDCQRPD